MTDTTPKQAGYLALASHLPDDVQPWEIARMVESVLEAVTPIISEEAVLNAMREEGGLKWVADAIITSAREPLIEMIDELVQQACYVPADGMGEMYYDSMALSVYADAMHFLALEGRLVITSEYGRRVIADRVKKDE
jgi:hypothetical protein